MVKPYPRRSPRHYDRLAHGIARRIMAPLPVRNASRLATDWKTMPGSTHADFRTQSWRQFCRLAPFLTDHHLRCILEQTVAPAFAVAHAELWARRRGKPAAAFARQVAMYLAHVECGLTLTEVGRLFARDRTTVAHACSRIEDRRDEAPFDRSLALLEGILRLLFLRQA
jgi:hypothetical protein